MIVVIEKAIATTTESKVTAQIGLKQLNKSCRETHTNTQNDASTCCQMRCNVVNFY